ncbi:MAG: hypothetical protein V4548_03645 [Bacteroidota bacterium]
MKKQLLNFITVLIVLSLSSCASIFNSKQTYTHIVTNQPSKLTINGQENSALVNDTEIWINRTKEPLKITAESEGNKKTVFVHAKNSFMFWANLYNDGIGMLIDKNNPKRYYYPRTIYIDIQDTLTTYQTYLPYKKINDLLKNQIKFTPLKLFGLVNPGIELAYERKTNSEFATQYMCSLLFDNKQSNLPLTGFRTSVEEKFFYRKSAPIGPYLSFEINYLQKKYYDTSTFDVEEIYSDPNYLNSDYSDTYGINKKTLSFNFKWGYQTIIKRLVIDFYTGLGLKYRSVQHFERINPNDEMVGTPHPNINFISNSEAKEWTISLPLNIKVGWIF